MMLKMVISASRAPASSTNMSVAHHRVGDRHELVRRVVVEADRRREARLEPRVAREQLAMSPRVARAQDDDEVVAVVLGALHQRVERLLAEGVAVVGDERVGLVDE